MAVLSDIDNVPISSRSEENGIPIGNISEINGFQIRFYALDPVWCSPHLQLSNENLTVTAPSGHATSSLNSVLGVEKLPPAKRYWEVLVDVGGLSTQAKMVGVQGRNMTYMDGSNNCHYAPDFRGYYDWNGQWAGPNGQSAAYGSIWKISGTKVGVAWDGINRKLFFSVDGVWQNGGDPVAGTAPAYSNIPAGDYYPAVALQVGGASPENRATINFGRVGFWYTPPSGYSALTL